MNLIAAATITSHKRKQRRRAFHDREMIRPIFHERGVLRVGDKEFSCKALPSERARTRSEVGFCKSSRMRFKVSDITANVGRASVSQLQELFINHWRSTGQCAVCEESIFGRSPAITTSFMCFLLEYSAKGFSSEHISHNRIPNEYTSTDLS